MERFIGTLSVFLEGGSPTAKVMFIALYLTGLCLGFGAFRWPNQLMSLAMFALLTTSVIVEILLLLGGSLTSTPNEYFPFWMTANVLIAVVVGVVIAALTTLVQRRT